jgi:hypothetical protein
LTVDKDDKTARVRGAPVAGKLAHPKADAARSIDADPMRPSAEAAISETRCEWCGKPLLQWKRLTGAGVPPLCSARCFNEWFDREL